MRVTIGFAALLATLGPVGAVLEIGRPFGDHMVLPMRRPVEIRGVSGAGAGVEVEFAGQRRATVAGPGGRWRVELPALEPSSRPRVLRVSSGGETVVIEDVLVGEVWLCSGQSNMDFPLLRAVGGREEAAAAAECPEIRLFDLAGVPTPSRAWSGEERERVTTADYFRGGWKVASEPAAGGFSAVGWWAGKMIHRARGVPVGLVDNSVGGSGAEAWLPRERIEADPRYGELRGPQWMVSRRVPAWARGRARVNRGGRPGPHPYQPGFLFDAGVRWWRGFPLAGVLWYQGETNAELRDDAWNERLIVDLVGGWREALGQPQLPFVMVQLPEIGGSDPLRAGWPQFREVQARAAARLRRVEVVVTRDLGWDSADVHPPDKRPVGERLGRAALGVGPATPAPAHE